MFFNSVLGKVVTYALLAFVSFGAIFGAIKYHDAGIRREQNLILKSQQLEKALEAKNKFIEQQEKFTKNLEVIIDDLEKKNSELNKKVEDARTFLRSKEAEDGDRDSSSVLKETLKRLGAPK